MSSVANPVMGLSVPSAIFVIYSELGTYFYRIAEAKALEDKLAKEKKALEEYLKKVGQTLFAHSIAKYIIIHSKFESIFLQTQDALEHKQKMEAENKALKEKLDREASELQKKILFLSLSSFCFLFFISYFMFIHRLAS